MTKGIEFVFEYLPRIMDKKKVCEGCRDKTKCPGCAFSQHYTNKEVLVQEQKQNVAGETLHHNPDKSVVGRILQRFYHFES